MHDLHGGTLLEEADLAGQILAADSQGLTLVGGEPLEQIAGIKNLLDILDAKLYQGNKIIFSGFTWKEICEDAEKIELVKRFDLLVAGPFEQNLAPDRRKWIGSTNQTVHFFSDRLRFLENAWPGHMVEIEIHISEDGLSINGFPTGDDGDFEKIFINEERLK
jgi:anaerobic ribonucleoside-triphosphate reductase activating protein